MKETKKQNESNETITLTKLICATILGLISIIGIFFGNEALLAIGIVFVLLSLLAVFSIN